MAESAPAPAASPSAPSAPSTARGFRLGLRSKFTAWLALFILGILAATGYRVRKLEQAALDREIKERGLALARALAANSVEPLSLGEGKTLDIMLLVKEVVQTTTDPEPARQSVAFNDTAAE